MVSSKLVAPERVSRGMAWVFILLLGATAAASLGLQGTMESAGAHGAATYVIEHAAALVTEGTAMLVDAAAAAWQATLRELARVVRAVLDWQWWPAEISLYLRGGADVFHS